MFNIWKRGCPNKVIRRLLCSDMKEMNWVYPTSKDRRYNGEQGPWAAWAGLEWRLPQSLGWGSLPCSVCAEDCFEGTHPIKLSPTYLTRFLKPSSQIQVSPPHSHLFTSDIYHQPGETQGPAHHRLPLGRGCAQTAPLLRLNRGCQALPLVQASERGEHRAATSTDQQPWVRPSASLSINGLACKMEIIILKSHGCGARGDREGTWRKGSKRTPWMESVGCRKS